MTTHEYGIGLEAEGFIMDAEGCPLSRIEGLPASAWVMEQLKVKSEKLIEHVGLELASVFLEVKTGIHQSGAAAVAEVQKVRAELDRLLAPKGARLVFVPVSERPFEFVASSEAPGSRSAELVARWGQSSDGVKNLLASSIASLQINDSRPFQYCVDDYARLEVARQLHNSLAVSLPAQAEHYTFHQKDFRGQTRLENYCEIVRRVESEKFTVAGFDPEDAIIPPHFTDIDQMLRWMCTYSGVTNFDHTNPKDEHALTCKMKRHPWMVEVRYPDAVDGESAMLHTVTTVESLINSAYVY